ncbi:MAG: hypothetical protein ISP90_00725 [Nevskia sp.]|nr:hypothetical protein [Nevskia sp.]
MIDSPSAAEMLDGIAHFIDTRVRPQLSGHDAYMARVTITALAIVKRELEQGPAAESAALQRLRALLGRADGDFAVLNKALCEDIRHGAIDWRAPAVMDHLKRSIADQVRIDQPDYSGLKVLEAEPPAG